jgi:hypothetical protein
MALKLDIVIEEEAGVACLNVTWQDIAAAVDSAAASFLSRVVLS